MNREIKFRAWDVTNKIMRDVLLIKWHYDEKTMNKILSWVEYFDFNKKEYFRMYPHYLIDTPNPEEKYCGESTFKLIQFTGLLDRNGKEIWEGDIVEYENSNAGYGRPRNEEISRDIIPKLTKHEDFVDRMMWWKLGEVIGNVLEHPELLNKQKE